MPSELPSCPPAMSITTSVRLLVGTGGMVVVVVVEVVVVDVVDVVVVDDVVDGVGFFVVVVGVGVGGGGAHAASAPIAPAPRPHCNTLRRGICFMRVSAPGCRGPDRGGGATAATSGWSTS